MKKIIALMVIAGLLFVLGGCVTTKYVPVTGEVPEVTIEKPPEMKEVKWVKIEIEGVPYYALPEVEALKLKINIKMSEEYKKRCFNLIGEDGGGP